MSWNSCWSTYVVSRVKSLDFGQTFCLRRATRQHNLTLWVLLARSTRVSWESAMVFMKEPSTPSTIKQWLIRRFKMKPLMRLWTLNSWMISMALISGTDQGLGRRCRYLDWRKLGDDKHDWKDDYRDNAFGVDIGILAMLERNSELILNARFSALLWAEFFIMMQDLRHKSLHDLKSSSMAGRALFPCIVDLVKKISLVS